MNKKFDIRKSGWVCTQKFKKKETFSKFIMMCNFAGISVVPIIETTHDIHEWPYIGKCASSKSLDRWADDRGQPFSSKLKHLTRAEAYKHLKATIKKRRVPK
jgi:hypothetical protein